VSDPILQHPAITAEDAQAAPLTRYLKIIRKRIWVVAAVVAVAVTAVVFFTMSQREVYQAQASIIIDPQAPQVFGTKFQDVIELGAANTQSQEYYNTQLSILTNYELAQQTVINNRLWENPKLVPVIEGDTRTRDELIRTATEALVSALGATQNRESRIVNVLVKHTDAELAVELANKHVETFLTSMRSLRSDGTGKVAEFLSSELDSAQTRLKTTEEEVLRFKRENDILSMSLENKQSILANDIAKYSGAVSDSRVRRMELDAMRKRLEQLKGEAILDSPLFGLTGTLASNATIVGLLKDSYYREKQRLNELGEELGPRHPSYVAQKAKVDESLATIESEARVAVRELDERYQALLTNERTFTAELERLKKEAFELAPRSLEYVRLVRQQQSDEANFNLVLERLRDTELSSRNTEINVRTHSMARTTTLVYPRMKLNVVLAVLASLLIGVGLAFLLELLDRTLKSAEDVNLAVAAPFLGVIPLIEELRGDDAVTVRNRDLHVMLNPTSPAAECCRSIRTNILFASAERRMKVLTVSSPRPREGKTTTTIYMGSIMAQGGQKILLVDTDLRRPRLHKSFGVPREPGLTSLIMGECSIEEAIKTTEIPNLYVLPCGPLPPNPAELLLTQRFKDVLAMLEERFDRIMLDSPPLLAVTDGVILSRLSDGVVLIAQASKTSTEDARQAARLLRDVNAPILGVILNDVNLSEKRYGYYQYNYGQYGNLEKIPEPSTEAP
jgi:succinoglycan biosynthesis transport protein ExoP